MYMYVELINKLLHVMHLLTKFDSFCFLFIPSPLRTEVILTSTERDIFRMLFSIKNKKNYDVVSLL